MPAQAPLVRSWTWSDGPELAPLGAGVGVSRADARRRRRRGRVDNERAARGSRPLASDDARRREALL